MRQVQELGYRYIRVQLGGYGGLSKDIVKPEGAPEGHYFDRKQYMRAALEMFECVRKEVGDEVELLHDVHERLTPIEAVGFARDVEQFKLHFLEDPLAPEDLEWFKNIRQQCATPIAMGELFNNPREWQPLIEGRLIDFLRMHVSQMGGITPARHVAAVANMYGIRTAWHGPGDTSPVGHAANLHLDLWAPNFGVQEWYRPELARRNPEGAKLNQRPTTCSPACPKCATDTCMPMTVRAWASTSTRIWPIAFRWPMRSDEVSRRGCRTARRCVPEAVCLRTRLLSLPVHDIAAHPLAPFRHRFILALRAVRLLIPSA